jgi:hypothetical protein
MLSLFVSLRTSSDATTLKERIVVHLLADLGIFLIGAGVGVFATLMWLNSVFR